MRTPPYLSYSAVSCFEYNREEFFLRYLADVRPPRPPQTQPMSVGSAFDAYIKSYINEKLFGSNQFEFDAIFNKQVEESNRDFAREAGKHIFSHYLKYGGAKRLLDEIEKATTQPRLQDKIEATIDGIPLLGYTDLDYMISDFGVVLDFKVNNYCGNNKKYPATGYVYYLDLEDSKTSRHGHMHKDCMLDSRNGFTVNGLKPFELVNADFAKQTIFYGKILGYSKNMIAAIDQIVCNPPGPKLALACHRGIVSDSFIDKYWETVKSCWSLCNDYEKSSEGITLRYPHVFPELNKDDSDTKCQQLEERHKAYQMSNDPNEQFFFKATR